MSRGSFPLDLRGFASVWDRSPAESPWATGHILGLRNSRIKKLRHGIFDFGLRNYGIRSWGGARKRFQVPNPHDSRLLCVRPPVPCDLPPAPRPTSRTQGHAQLRSVAAGATMHFVHVWHRTNLLSSVRAARGRFHASRYMPRIDGFTRRVPAAGAPEGLTPKPSLGGP